MIGMREFSFAAERFVARQSGALWWPRQQMLIIADLHLGRSQRYARRFGQLLPPWHEIDTLTRLATEVAALQPAAIVSLGDGFDDLQSASELAPDAFAILHQIAQGREFIWVSGNHDPGPLPVNLPGRQCDEWRDHWPGAITLRHELQGDGPDISAHLHPVAPLAGRRWRCFAHSTDHLILPAFGAYTGGLSVTDPAFQRYMPKGIAICCSETMFAMPFPALRKARR